MGEQRCIECQHRIFGRSDKRFCSDACRINYHNRKRRLQYDNTRPILRILLNNRNLLQWFWEQGKKTCKKQELIEKGFNFNYITQLQWSHCRPCYYCFDWCYQIQFKRISISPAPK